VAAAAPLSWAEEESTVEIDEHPVVAPVAASPIEGSTLGEESPTEAEASAPDEALDDAENDAPGDRVEDADAETIRIRFRLDENDPRGYAIIDMDENTATPDSDDATHARNEGAAVQAAAHTDDADRALASSAREVGDDTVDEQETDLALDPVIDTTPFVYPVMAPAPAPAPTAVVASAPAASSKSVAPDETVPTSSFVTFASAETPVTASTPPVISMDRVPPVTPPPRVTASSTVVTRKKKKKKGKKK